MQTSQVHEIPLSDIRLQGINVRSDLNSANSQEALDELAASIKENGLMQPILLRGPEGNKPYDVVVGQRRFLAHQRLGLLTIKATFTDTISDTDAIILSLSENLLRQDLNEADIMRVVTGLYEKFGKDEYKVKDKLGLSITAIRRYINVEATATPKIKSMINDGKLSLLDAKRAIEAAQGDANKANAIVDQMVTMTKHDIRRAAEYGKSNPKATADEIVNYALAPVFEPTIILNLHPRIKQALQKASETLTKDSEDIIMDALTEWLITNDFIANDFLTNE